MSQSTSVETPLSKRPALARSRRWAAPQFSLRSLFIVTTLACIVLGIWISRAERQRRACAELTRCGWSWAFTANDSDPKEAEPAWLGRIPKPLRQGEAIHYWRTVKSVADGPGDALAALEQLPSLRKFEIRFGSYEMDKRLWPIVGRLGALEKLTLSDSAIDDDGLRSIGRLRKLRKLDLGQTIVGNEGVKHLAGLESLEELSLDDTNITDEALDTLAKLPSLKTLSLSRTRATDAALDALGAKRPNLAIDPGDTDFWSAVVTSEFEIASEVETTTPGQRDLKVKPVEHYLLALTLDGTDLDADWTKALESLRLILKLTLRGRDFNEANLSHLSECHAFQQVRLERTSLSEAAYQWLGSRTRLDALDIVGSPVTASNIEALYGSTELKSLRIHDTTLDLATFQAILAMPHLRKLTISNCALPAGAIEAFHKSPKEFESLVLNNTGLSPVEFALNPPIITPESALVWDGVRVPFRYVSRTYDLAYDFEDENEEDESEESESDEPPSPRLPWGLVGWGCCICETPYYHDQLTLPSRFVDERTITARLVSLPAFRKFDFAGAEVGSRTIDLLAANRWLQALDVSGSRVGDRDLRHARNWSHLQRLDLSRCEITDAGVAHLELCWRLASLRLDNTKVGDGCLETLSKLSHLRQLSLRGTAITDEGVMRLRGLQQLAILRLSGTNVSDKMVKALRDAMPGCKIEYVPRSAYAAWTIRNDP